MNSMLYFNEPLIYLQIVLEKWIQSTIHNYEIQKIDSNQLVVLCLQWRKDRVRVALESP